MLSPSEIAWLNLRAPVTGRDAISAMSGGVQRVCLLGAESTGKTTLASALAAAYGTVWNPEYGRVYTEVGRPRSAPWRSEEFEHIARVHCWYEDFLAGVATRVLFADTDAFTTAVFHEAYLGEPAHGFDDLAARRYDLYLVCGLDVPFEHDGWRDRVTQREWMHERYVAHARESGSPWLLVAGSPEERLVAARDAVDRLLAPVD
jgi:HTH-type transcriptional repressor of NAD biosynthesis genes